MQRHIDPLEAQEVVLLAAERRKTSLDGPTVEGLVASLGLSESEVERMLAEVRARRTTPAVAARRSFGDRSAALSAAIVLALVVVAGIGSAGYLFVSRRERPVDVIATPLVEATRVLPAPESPTTPASAAPTTPAHEGGHWMATGGGDGQTTFPSSPADGARGSKMRVRTEKDGTVTVESTK